MKYKDYIKEYKDFPIDGINYLDLNPIYKNGHLLKTITEDCLMPSAAFALTCNIASKHNFTRQCYVFLADNIIDGTLPTFNLSKPTSTVPITPMGV